MDLDQNRLEQSQDLGFAMAEGYFDVIFHTSASKEGLQYALDHVRKEGAVIELSWYGNKQIDILLGGNFHYNRIKLISSQVSTVSPFAPIQGYKERKDIACQLLLNEVFDKVISNEILFQDVPTYFDSLRSQGGNHALATVIKYS
jgi:threonine dehydrogenase-like Zn-dependent dehydrogenase